MTLPSVVLQPEIGRLLKAIPYLQSIAKEEAQVYYEFEPSNTAIQAYLLKYREYDAVEIAWIVNAFKDFTKILI